MPNPNFIFPNRQTRSSYIDYQLQYWNSGVSVKQWWKVCFGIAMRMMRLRGRKSLNILSALFACKYFFCSSYLGLFRFFFYFFSNSSSSNRIWIYSFSFLLRIIVSLDMDKIWSWDLFGLIGRCSEVCVYLWDCRICEKLRKKLIFRDECCF